LVAMIVIIPRAIPMKMMMVVLFTS
jgi:hypothetical protein